MIYEFNICNFGLKLLFLMFFFEIFRKYIFFVCIICLLYIYVYIGNMLILYMDDKFKLICIGILIFY